MSRVSLLIEVIDDVGRVPQQNRASPARGDNLAVKFGFTVILGEEELRKTGATTEKHRPGSRHFREIQTALWGTAVTGAGAGPHESDWRAHRLQRWFRFAGCDSISNPCGHRCAAGSPADCLLAELFRAGGV